MAWHDIVVGDTAKPLLPKLLAAIITFWDFLTTGTVARYFRANWRYVLFFLVPFFEVVLFVILAVTVGVVVARNLPLPIIAPPTGAGIAIAAFLLLMRWPGYPWRVRPGLTDWITSREYMYNRRADMANRIEAFARRVLACVQRHEALRPVFPMPPRSRNRYEAR